MMSRSEQEQMVVRCRNGDRTAFEPLMRAHEQRVYGFLLSLCGDPDEAKDLLQETFLLAWRRIGRCDPERPLHPWLLALARRRFLDSRRKREGRGSAPRRFSELSPDLPTQEIAPDEAAEIEVRYSQLWQALDRLPPAQRELLVLKDITGLPYDEIARMLGVPRGTVASRVYYARRELAVSLGVDPTSSLGADSRSVAPARAPGPDSSRSRAEPICL
jgi:RNA polymerase sigma-70 factor (ECF subfamily)